MKKVKGKDILFFVVLAAMTFFVIKERPISINIVKGSSMSPTLQEGEIKVMNGLKFLKPKKGEVVTLRSPQSWGVHGGQIYIKRLIATEGDVVSIKDEVLYVNDEKVATLTDKFPYISIPNISFEIGHGYSFVMGDNIGNSLDSLYYLLSEQFKNDFLIPNDLILSHSYIESKNEELQNYVNLYHQ